MSVLPSRPEYLVSFPVRWVVLERHAQEVEVGLATEGLLISPGTGSRVTEGVGTPSTRRGQRLAARKTVVFVLCLYGLLLVFA